MNGLVSSPFFVVRRVDLAKRSKKAQEAFDLALPVAKEMGYDLVDCEYKKEGQDLFLRLFIDKKGGVGLDDCEAFSAAVDPIIDSGMQSDADYFEVSSPGLTRPLETIEDYVRYEGEKLDITLFAARDGVKNFTSVLKSYSGDRVVLEAENGTEYDLALSDIAKAVRHIDF